MWKNIQRNDHRYSSMLHAIFWSSLLGLTLAHSLPAFLRQNNFTSNPIPCDANCLFRFCESFRFLFLLAPGYATRPEICHKSQEVDQILETGEALVRVESELVPISKWRPEGLDTPFPPDYFKAGKIFGRDNSGIERAGAQGNQNLYITGHCFVLPIHRYERVRILKNGKKRPMRWGKPSPRNCIAFDPVSFDIMFEVQWQSGDDLDLSVEEPDGTIVDYKNLRSKCGAMRGGDTGVDGCYGPPEFVERIGYSRACEELQKGIYTIRLRHTSNCLMTGSPETTPYEIRVVIDGNAQVITFGTSNLDSGETIVSIRYVI